ncbi:hypothetical protein HHA04nite_13160 [Halomonas halophila]|uniref:Uncharacterized protein n=1 Tax=Halomonas halophila TaxID=29573 RepID=A0ABQ0U2L1_9GAMM|nr:hypothetical protein HHA04nite_13160 [Halomonas halophila]
MHAERIEPGLLAAQAKQQGAVAEQRAVLVHGQKRQGMGPVEQVPELTTREAVAAEGQLLEGVERVEIASGRGTQDRRHDRASRVTPCGF